MRVLVVSGELIASSICNQLLKEGHEVKLYIERAGWQDCLENIIPKTDDWRAELKWVGTEGLIIFDDVGFGEEQDLLRSQGFTVVGGSAGADKLEFDRAYFQQLLKLEDINILPSHNFNSIDEAIAFIETNPDQWVIKQGAHVGMLNYVGERNDGKDCINLLQSYKKYHINAIHLQKRVHGIEVGVARYFNGTDWVGPIEINHEHKRLCNDDVGPLTHEMGTVSWYSDNENLPLYKETLGKLKKHLQEIDFRGDIDINCIVNETGIWPLEATPRFGNPSTPLQCELNISPWGEFLQAVALGKEYDMQYKNTFGVVVSIALPPFPNPPAFADPEKYRNNDTLLSFADDFDTSLMDHIHLEEISKRSLGGEDVLYWAGTDGWVLHVTGEGETIPEAQRKTYDIINQLILPKKFYRTDIGTRVHYTDLPRLKEWGYI